MSDAPKIKKQKISWPINLALKRQFNLKWVKVYGSRSREDNSPTSDIDIAVDGSNLSRDQWVQVASQIRDNPYSILKIDVVEFSSLNDEAFKQRILDEGVDI